MAPPRFRDEFKISEMALRLIRAYPDIPRDIYWILQYIAINIVSGALFCCFSYSVFCHDIPNGDYGEACKNGTMVIMFIVVNSKYWIVVYHQRKLAYLLATIDNDPRRDSYDSEQEAAVIKYWKKGIFVCRLWLFAAWGVPALLILHAALEMCWLAFKGQFRLVPIFDLTYPDPINALKYTPLVYIANFTHCMAYAVFIVSGYIGFDPMAPCMLLHACGQLEVVRLKLKKLFPAIGYSAEDTDRKLRDIVTHLQEIYELVEEMSKIFVVLYEIVVKLNTLLIPLTAIQIMQRLQNNPKDIPVDFIVLEFGCLIHFFVPCYYSDLLSQKSDEVREALYASGWENRWAGKEIRARLLLILCRTTKPLVLRTVFRNISLNAFAEMFQNSYVIFNLINLMSK